MRAHEKESQLRGPTKRSLKWGAHEKESQLGGPPGQFCQGGSRSPKVIYLFVELHPNATLVRSEAQHGIMRLICATRKARKAEPASLRRWGVGELNLSRPLVRLALRRTF